MEPEEKKSGWQKPEGLQMAEALHMNTEDGKRKKVIKARDLGVETLMTNCDSLEI